MADEMVIKAQRFINEEFVPRNVGIAAVKEDGRTSWDLMYALTRCLQYEIGVAPLSDNFGPTTLSALGALHPRLNATTVGSERLCRIVQAALYCKGYDGGGIDGKWSTRVSTSVTNLKTDMGVEAVYPGDDLTPKVLKALLTMDPYVTVNGGTDRVRAVQRWLNGRYVDRADFFVVPCDGHHSRGVARSMLLAVQYELGMADGVANGVFGPGTRAGLKQKVLTTGAQGTWVRLLTAALILNQRAAEFTESFGPQLHAELRTFQDFCRLPVTGNGDFQTWASLLVSYGDQERRGTACDGVTKITPAIADTLKAAGIRYVGRYLTNPSATGLAEKAIQPGELATIASAGLNCFPIYQTYGRDEKSFSHIQGKAAGLAACNAASDHGFKDGTRIFFAVDFDAYDYQVTDHVIPHFQGIRDAMSLYRGRYQVGIYGPRNVCSRVGAAGLSSASFVCDMSSNFSGNYGYSLPADWAYDQISTITIGSGAGGIEIDNNVASGRDTGQNSFYPAARPVPDVWLSAQHTVALSMDLNTYMQSDGWAESDLTHLYSHSEAMQIVLDCDPAITDAASTHHMRKALIQTSLYWEMRHIDKIKDKLGDEGVISYHTRFQGPFVPRDASTGIGQIQGVTGILAWNHAVDNGRVTGPRYSSSDSDLFAMWQRLRGDNEFACRMIALVHLWGAAGKPGDAFTEKPMRPAALNYTEYEIYEILRRYQGPINSEASTEAQKRMPLYHLFERYNSLSR
ncbi:glycoside hydrolase domain-containing protein [Streptomyces sp. NPDC056402]|uniref:glycoside hydrolase domain-containing protein n=1 Tax=Streptomyces sp. NPDC056402 TaxID=3345810 RepID=UPI0035D5C06C